jgi:hypothetical protein
MEGDRVEWTIEEEEIPFEGDGEPSWREQVEHERRNPPRNFWATAPEDEWVVGLRFGVRDGHPILGELRIFPDEGPSYERSQGRWSGDPASIPEAGLPATLVHGLGLWGLENEVRAALKDYKDPAWPGDRVWDDPSDPHWQPAEHWLSHDALVSRLKIGPTQTGPTRRPGRPPLSDETLALVAYHYVEALKAGRPVHSYVEKQMREGDEHKPVAQWIHKARERGFLEPPLKPRQKGGRLLPKARALLGEMGVLPTESDADRPDTDTDTEGETQ